MASTRLRAARQRRHLVGQRPQQRDLDLAVLVAPEHVLERLERLDQRLDDVGGDTAAPRTARAGSAAPCPSCAARGSPRPGSRRRSLAHPDARACRPCGSARRPARRSASSASGRSSSGQLDQRLEQQLPVGQQLVGAPRGQRPRQSPVRRQPPVLEHLAQRLEVGADRSRHQRPHRLELRARRRRGRGPRRSRAAASGTRLRKPGSSSGREHRRQLALDGPRAPDRDPQLVQKLGVVAGDRPVRLAAITSSSRRRTVAAAASARCS